MSATWTIAAVTLRRVTRGRALWVAAAVALLPVFFAYVMRESRDHESSTATIVDVFAFEELVLAVLPALLVAATIGEEIEERTTTYLWSRPLPRWSMLAGKLVAMVPVIWGIAIASWYLAMAVGILDVPPVETTLALVLDATAISLVGAAIATLVPRYAMALVICYSLFFDLPLGAMPASIDNISVAYHARVIAGTVALTEDVSPTTSVVWILAIALIWTAVGVLRIRRLEA